MEVNIIIFMLVNFDIHQSHIRVLELLYYVFFNLTISDIDNARRQYDYLLTLHATFLRPQISQFTPVML